MVKKSSIVDVNDVTNQLGGNQGGGANIGTLNIWDMIKLKQKKRN